jgi:hypothetical protein
MSTPASSPGSHPGHPPGIPAGAGTEQLSMDPRRKGWAGCRLSARNVGGTGLPIGGSGCPWRRPAGGRLLVGQRVMNELKAASKSDPGHLEPDQPLSPVGFVYRRRFTVLWIFHRLANPKRSATYSTPRPFPDVRRYTALRGRCVKPGMERPVALGQRGRDHRDGTGLRVAHQNQEHIGQPWQRADSHAPRRWYLFRHALLPTRHPLDRHHAQRWPVEIDHPTRYF